MFISRTEFSYYKNHRKVICFGAGEIAIKMLNIVGDYFDYYIDNDKQKHKSSIYGKTIYSPVKLLKEQFEKVFVVICTEDYQTVRNQLEDMGFVFANNIGYSILLKNYIAYELISMGSTRICVSCYNGKKSGLYIVNSRSGDRELLHEGRFHGIHAVGDEVFVVNRTEGLWCLDKNSLEIKNKYKIPDLFQPCGLTYNPQQDVFYVVETGRDRILIISAKSYKVQEIHNYSDLFSKKGVEQHHINDIIVIDESIWLSMFSLSGKWRYNIFDGTIAEYDFNFNIKNIFINNANKPHSLMVKEHALYYLDSFTGYLKTGNGKKIAQFPGFMRGLDKDFNRFYIGLSRHRHIEDISTKTFPTLTNSGLFVYSSEYNVYKYIPLEDVYDVYGILDISNDGL